MLERMTYSVEETEQFGRMLAGRLRPGDLLVLSGDLGAGKTALVRGLAAGLGLEDEVSSPTFVIMNEYRGRGPVRLCHFDFSRLRDEDDLYSTGYYDLLGTDAILAVEWGERIPEALPKAAIWVRMKRVDAQTRRITVEGDERF